MNLHSCPEWRCKWFLNPMLIGHQLWDTIRGGTILGKAICFCFCFTFLLKAISKKTVSWGLSCTTPPQSGGVSTSLKMILLIGEGVIHSCHQVLLPISYNMNSYKFPKAHLKYYPIFKDFPDVSHQMAVPLFYAITESCTDIYHEPSKFYYHISLHISFFYHTLSCWKQGACLFHLCIFSSSPGPST